METLPKADFKRASVGFFYTQVNFDVEEETALLPTPPPPSGSKTVLFSADLSLLLFLSDLQVCAQCVHDMCV